MSGFDRSGGFGQARFHPEESPAAFRRAGLLLPAACADGYQRDFVTVDLAVAPQRISIAHLAGTLSQEEPSRPATIMAGRGERRRVGQPDPGEADRIPRA